jgi:hypothetical protein
MWTITARMLIAVHPENDSKTERVNQTIEAFLRAIVNLEIHD